MTSVLGWGGSVLLLLSLAQSRLYRLYALNLAASASLLGYNVAIHALPQVVTNALLAGINAWKLRGLRRNVNSKTPLAAQRGSLNKAFGRHRAAESKTTLPEEVISGDRA